MELLQLRVLRFGLLQDGDVGIGVFSKCEEVLVGGPSLRTIALEGVGAGQTETGQRAQREIYRQRGVEGCVSPAGTKRKQICKPFHLDKTLPREESVRCTVRPTVRPSSE
jgi:hypothetical protein